MANKILVQEMDDTPPQISFATHASLAATTNLLEQGTPTEIEIALASLADGSARQSAQADLSINRAEFYVCRAAIEFAATPTTSELVELYWNASSSSTAATGNMGGTTGSDAAYAGYSSNLSESVKQLQFIGVMSVTVQVTTTVQIAIVGVFSPAERYGSLVVKNESGAALHSDGVETHIVLDPIIPEVQ